MSSASTEDWRGPSAEFGWPCGGRLNPQRVWSLWKSGTLASAEICRHPLGYALRLYMGGGFLYSSVHPMRKAAEQEARELKRHWLKVLNGLAGRP